MYKILHYTMHGMAFHIDGTERTGRAQVFARTATDTPLGIDNRNLDGVRITVIRRNHQYGSRWTMAGTVAAIYTVGQRNTVLFYPYSMADACRRFLRDCYRTDGSCGTDFTASGTFRTAITAFVRHFGLHQACQAGGWTKYIVRAGRHTELAGGAMPCKISRAPCTWRNNRRSTFGRLLILDGS